MNAAITGRGTHGESRWKARGGDGECQCQRLKLKYSEPRLYIMLQAMSMCALMCAKPQLILTLRAQDHMRA